MEASIYAVQGFVYGAVIIHLCKFWLSRYIIKIIICAKCKIST